MGSKVICLGAVVADLVALPVTSLPAPGDLLIPEITLHIGGCAANSATGLCASKGSATLRCGGRDPFGYFLKDASRRREVLLDHFHIS